MSEKSSFDVGKLTRREAGVFSLIIKGYSTSAIAINLGISFKTVETHRSNINKKLGVTSPLELLRKGLLAGAITTPDLAP